MGPSSWQTPELHVPIRSTVCEKWEYKGINSLQNKCTGKPLRIFASPMIYFFAINDVNRTRRLWAYLLLHDCIMQILYNSIEVYTSDLCLSIIPHVHSIKWCYPAALSGVPEALNKEQCLTQLRNQTSWHCAWKALLSNSKWGFHYRPNGSLSRPG